jgi:hypothetical protein
MFTKVLWRVAGLAAVVTLPAVAFTTYDLFWKKGGARGEGSAATSGGTATAPPAPAAALLPGAIPNVEGPTVQDLAEILRFDVTPEWILRRWPRVSTGLARLQLQGYRVPLVTGTAESDLAGALTYYFNPQQQLQQITFQGTTGDARNLVAFLAGRLHFVRRLTNDPGLTVYEAVRSDGKPAGSVRIRSAGIVKASEPFTRFDVELALERLE